MKDDVANAARNGNWRNTQKPAAVRVSDKRKSDGGGFYFDDTGAAVWRFLESFTYFAAAGFSSTTHDGAPFSIHNLIV